MTFKPVFLVTDVLLFLLLFVIAMFVFFAMRSKQSRYTWRQVFFNPLGSISSLILIAYLSVGVLDSLHYREALPEFSNGKVYYSTEVKSVLDALLAPLGQEQEKTYSAPLATELYAKEFVFHIDGTKTRLNPPLKYAGQHLTETDSVAQDVIANSLVAIVASFLLWFILTYMLIVYLQKILGESKPVIVQKVMQGQLAYPWRSVLLTLFGLILVTMIAVMLAANYHLFGTDKVGNDVFYAALKSIRTGLLIGSLTTLIMLPFAVFFGTIAGYFGGVIDDAVQYLYTTLSSIPGVLLIAAAILSIQVYIDNHPDSFQTIAVRADARLPALCIILGVTSWTSLCRVLRAETLKLREMDYIQAARGLGSGWFAILSKHVLPNVLHIVLITVVLEFSTLVLAEAVLTYVGVGVDPTTYSWGNMIDAGRLELAREPIVWWPLLSAFVFMFVFVLAANLFADAVRDAFDPRTG